MDTKQYSIILADLENALTGARMLDDTEMVLRLSRAIAAFEADVDKDIFIENFVEDIVIPKMLQNIKQKEE